jgi:cellulose biosynthesis protein BcsQ
MPILAIPLSVFCDIMAIAVMVIPKGEMRMIIVVANNKGGQGKTMISTLLVRQLLTNPKNRAKGKITCCDLDKTQRNFTDNLKGLDIAVITDLANVSPENGHCCVVDTPPSLDPDTVRAILKADMLIVPIILGKHSVQGLLRIAEIRGRGNLKIVLNEWDNSTVQKQAEQHLKQSGFNIVGRLKKYKRLAFNMDAGDDWFAGFSEQQAKQIGSLLNKLLKEK